MLVMRTLRLRSVFATILTAAAGTAACGGTAGSPSSDGGPPGTGPTTPGYTSACPVGSLVQVIVAEPPLDYIAFRTEEGGRPPGVDAGADAGSPNFTDGESKGTACKTATDAAACQAKLAALRANGTNCSPDGSSITGYSCATYLVYTRGDTVGFAATAAEQTALIGHVDSAGEAIALAGLGGYTVVCGGTPPASEYKETADGFEVIVQKFENCGKTRDKITLQITRDGKVRETAKESLEASGVPCAIGGRRPDGIELPGSRCADPVGAFLSDVCGLELAAVSAFVELERELRASGAPEDLLQRLRIAARDEVRHARTTRDLARSFGANPERPKLAARRREPRPLFEVALENAREGQVRETYAALAAHWQAENAADPRLRSAMVQIAKEETSHAELSWDLAAWLESHLSVDERTALEQARIEARHTLAGELAVEPGDTLSRIAGLPTARTALDLLARLDAALA